MAADQSTEIIFWKLHIMKGKGAFKISAFEDRHFNGSGNGDLELKIAKCTPFKVYISNEVTGGVNLRVLGVIWELFELNNCCHTHCDAYFSF